MHKNYGEFSALSSENIPVSLSVKARIICRIMENDFKSRIKERLDILGLSARKASLLAGLHPDTLGKVLQGNTKSLRGDNLTKIARVLKCTEAWLETGEEAEFNDVPQPSGIRFGGIVEAGNFRRVNIFNQDADYAIVPLQPNPHYPFEAQFAFKVEGESMNLEKIFPGMWVHAVETSSWSRIHGEPNDGELVVVEVFRNDNQERELTVKMLRMFRDRIELQPRSSESHETYVIPHTQYEEFADKYRVKAVVLSSTWLHRFKGL
jgi:SOS-response transcriptional repressor LexA